MNSTHGMIYAGLLSGVMLTAGTASAQTNVPPPAQTPETTTPAPAQGGIARGVVPPPKQIDPEMVTPPPAAVTPTMPVIKPPANAR